MKSLKNNFQLVFDIEESEVLKTVESVTKRSEWLGIMKLILVKFLVKL